MQPHLNLFVPLGHWCTFAKKVKMSIRTVPVAINLDPVGIVAKTGACTSMGQAKPIFVLGHSQKHLNAEALIIPTCIETQQAIEE